MHRSTTYHVYPEGLYLFENGKAVQFIPRSEYSRMVEEMVKALNRPVDWEEAGERAKVWGLSLAPKQEPQRP